MQTIYVVRRNSDLNEGRGPMKTLGYFSSREAAQPARRGFGIMGIAGRDNMDTQLDEVTVYDTYEDWASQLDPNSYEAKIHRGTADPEYAEYLRLQKKFKGR